MDLRTTQPALRWHVGTCVLVLAIASGLAWLTGANLGLFIGGLALAALLMPFALGAWESARSGLIAAACVTDAIAVVWLWALWTGPAVHLVGWLGAYGVLVGLALAEAGLVALLRRATLSRPSAAGLVAIVVLLWLAAPIWLFPDLQSERLLPWMQRLISVHPVFAINSAVRLSVWTESPVAYTLMNLNQDVPYTLPQSPIAAILVHCIIGLALCLIWIKEPNRRAR